MLLTTMVSIGKRNTLTLIRLATPGAFLDGGELGDILLPKRYVPRGVKAGDRLEVFIYRDSEDRLVATTEFPRGMVGEISSLRVVSVNSRVGVFLDWGLSKDLLLPFREQIGRVRIGQIVPVKIYLDEKTGRIAASMKKVTGLAPEPAEYRKGQQVEFMLTERTQLGYKALVEGKHEGLLYHDSTPVPLATGETHTGFIRGVRADGKLDLSLAQPGYGKIAPLALRIMEVLHRKGGRLEMDDDSSPEAIRASFGTSKKAFKQALGSLYKTRRIRFAHPGIELIDTSTWSPGAGRGKRTVRR